jgi:hypothetical protein
MFIHELHHSIRGEKITQNPMLLTPEMTNIAISRKGAKTHKTYIYAKTAKIPLAEWQKIRTALASGFLIALEQVVLTPAFVYCTASEKRSILQNILSQSTQTL